MFQWDKSCSYDEEQKRRFHSTARSRLKKLATELELAPGSYDVRSNRAASPFRARSRSTMITSTSRSDSSGCPQVTAS